MPADSARQPRNFIPPPPRRHPVRIEHPNHARFLTFSCFDRLPLLGNAAIRDEFTCHLTHARERHRFALIGWVVMPEHVHLLIWPNVDVAPVSTILRSLKQGFAQRVIHRWRELDAKILTRLTDQRHRIRLWQRGGGYDRNIFTPEELSEKLDYMHRNPVERGLVQRTIDWKWSSARWYAGERDGTVPIDPVRKPE